MSERERNCDDGDGYGEGKARAPEQAREGIAAELVGAGPVGGRRTLETMEQIDGRGIVGGEPEERQVPPRRKAARNTDAERRQVVGVRARWEVRREQGIDKGKEYSDCAAGLK